MNAEKFSDVLDQLLIWGKIKKDDKLHIEEKNRILQEAEDEYGDLDQVPPPDCKTGYKNKKDVTNIRS